MESWHSLSLTVAAKDYDCVSFHAPVHFHVLYGLNYDIVCIDWQAAVAVITQRRLWRQTRRGIQQCKQREIV